MVAVQSQFKVTQDANKIISDNRSSEFADSLARSFILLTVMRTKAQVEMYMGDVVGEADIEVAVIIGMVLQLPQHPSTIIKGQDSQSLMR